MNRNDPGNYVKMLTPQPQGEVQEQMEKFLEELYELRNKYGIAEFVFVLEVWVEANEQRGPVRAHGSFGSEDRVESIAAWLLGRVQAERQTRIAELLADGGGIPLPKRRP